MDIFPQLIINSLITGSLYALSVVGIALLYNLHKVLNFAHGHLLMLGAYSFYFFNVSLEHSIFLSVVESGLVAILLVVITLKFFVFPFLPFNPMLVFVSTLAFGILLESLVSIFFGVNVKSLSYGFTVESYEIAGFFITPLQIFIIASSLVFFLLFVSVFQFSSYGRRIRALFESSFAAQSLGISLRKTSLITSSGAMLLTVFAGVLIAYESNIQPTMGNQYTIKAFAAMLLGGLGNLFAASVASFIIAVIENFAIGIDFFGYSLPAGYKDAFTFLIILLTLLFRPAGLFGSRNREL